MIYFDNAATTFPKPESVYKAVSDCIRYDCGNPGRSGHRMSLAAQEIIYECRNEIATLFNTEPEYVAFTLNTTYSLNTVIVPMLSTSDSVIISDIEHNAVLRPVIACGCEYTVADFNNENSEQLIKPNTKAIICSYASNLLPIVNPIRKISKAAKKHSIPLIVDAAQAAGVINIDLEKDGIDILCIPSHKSLYGIQGCGAVVFSRKYAENNNINTFIYGGTGVYSKDLDMPDFLPERLESGTLPTPAISSLCAGINEIKKIGIKNIFDEEMRLINILKSNLSVMKKIKPIYHGNYDIPIFSFNIANIPSQHIANELDRHGICVRGGFHCAPLAHKKAGTYENGAVRCSLGIFNTENETAEFCNILNKIVKEISL